MTWDEQPQRKIDRKWAFSQSTGVSEAKDTHLGGAQKEKVPDACSEQAPAEEKQDEEDDIDRDYDLTKSPFDPMGNYLGSKQETTPAIRGQPVLHDALPRYVTEAKYLIDLVPTQKGPRQNNLRLPVQLHPWKLRMRTMTLSKNRQMGNILNRWRLTTKVQRVPEKTLVGCQRFIIPFPDWRKIGC